jgi:hypothetical protein
MQYTHPTDVSIDPFDPQAVHIGGLYTIDGSWGIGGAWYTTDGGTTWKKNEDMPLEANLSVVTFVPGDPEHIFYGFFGGGMLYGPKP